MNEPNHYGFTRIQDDVLARNDFIRGDIIFLHQNRLRRIRRGTESHEAVSRLLPKIAWSEKFPPVPNSIQIQVTKACNLSCSFCYANAINASSSEAHMTFANAKRLIDTAFNWGVPQLQWVGGEAFVNKDFPKIVEYAQSLGLVQNIITNGIIPGVRPKKFMNTLRAFSTFQVSANAVGDSYNIIVGKSVYEKFVQSVKLINDSCGNVWLSCVVTRKNARSLNQIVSLGELVGARGITFGILAKQGRAVANAMNYFECLNWARESLNSVLTSDGPAIEIDCHFDPTMSRLQKAQSVEKRHGGYEGHSILFINKDGDIYPFPLLEMNSLKLGNAFIDDLRQLWFSSELLTSLRAAADPLLCEGCDSDCSFRSRSLRYLWTGSFSGKLPCYRFDFKK